MAWKIPLSDIDIGEQEKQAVAAVLDSRWLTMGEVTTQFETAFSRMLGSKYAFAVSNGTAALHIALCALGIGEGDEVICPSLTFVATSNAILYAGATPVFADIISSHRPTISPDDITRKITPRTRAIMVMHYGGYPCEMDDIIAIAERNNLKVIEDSAHAPMAEHNGRKLGTIGDAGCFSFFSNKNMTTGEGGIITCSNDAVAARLRLLRSHGMTTLTLQRHAGHAYTYDVVELGYNYRIDEIRSAIGLVQLSKLAANNERRRQIVKKYISALNGMPGVTIPFADYQGEPACHLFPIVLSGAKISRDDFMVQMKQRGIQTSVHYQPIHLFSYYAGRFGFQRGMLPVTEAFGANVVTLPLYASLDDAQIAQVTEAVHSILG